MGEHKKRAELRSEGIRAIVALLGELERLDARDAAEGIRPFEVQWQGITDSQWYYGDSRSTVGSAKSFACRLLSAYADWVYRARVVHVPESEMVEQWENPNPDALSKPPLCAETVLAQFAMRERERD